MELDNILKEVGNKQADLDKLEKENEMAGLHRLSKKKFVGMDGCQIALVSTDSDEVKRAFKLSEYEYQFNGETNEPHVNGLQRVVITLKYLQNFFTTLKKAETGLRRLENKSVGSNICLYVSKDKPIKVVVPLLDCESGNNVDEVVFWLAPRIETEMK